MKPVRKRAVSAGLALIAFGIAAFSGLIVPVFEAPIWAEPLAQVQPSPSPVPARPNEQRIQELELRKLEFEVRLLDMQEERTRQEREIARQPWRAPAEFVSYVGPTLVGLGLLYLIARALAHWLPEPKSEPEPAARAADENDDDDL